MARPPHYFLKGDPMQALGIKHYDEVFKTDKEYQSHYKDSRYFNIWKQIVDFVKEIRDPRILDVGCGTGQLGHYLEDEGMGSYFGFDFSKEAIRVARSLSLRWFSVGDAYNGNMYTQTNYNTVIISEVLEHLDYDLEVLKNIKPGANIIFSVPRFLCNGHMRCFVEDWQVENRYHDLIKIEKIVKVDNIKKTDKLWIVAKGVMI